MALRKVIPYGDPLLRRQSSPIESIDNEVLELIRDMKDTVAEAGGVGLAAPQLGESRMLFLIDWSHLEDGCDIIAYLNPEILESGGKMVSDDEGCLSFPQTVGEVTRPDSIEVKYQTIDGSWVIETLSDFPARVFQHEYDHLLGVLFIDRISLNERTKIKTKLQAILSGELKPFDGIKVVETESVET